ncbi:transporter substrate-binding domain-containing protein [Ensifer sp. IC3342]|nr:transporter substrate-binding domain-containing protein [Ensifer sp. BRP08]MCA1450793.1 transporter substrate-binding domain-containing protein [Ensifer sp. IC3342]
MRPLFTKLVLAALIPAHALTDAARADTIGGEEITVGVRSDARPFIWQDRNTNGYNGFFWDICTEAVQRAGYRFKAVNVETGKRAKFLSTGAGDFDLLCDPTTITLKRMQNFAYDGGAPHLEFSPIIFVANGSYVQQQRRAIAPKAAGNIPEGAPGKPTCNEVVSWLDRVEGDKPEAWKWWPAPRLRAADLKKAPPHAAEGFFGWFNFDFTLRRQPQGGDEKMKTFEVWGYVEGSTSEETVKLQATAQSRNGLMVCPRAMSSHEDAARAFCSGSLARYYGDVDMIRAALAGYSEDTGTRCAADFTPAAAGSYEPYAFVVSTRHFSDFPERLTLALYGMFEDGTVERLFTGHFPETQKSHFLGTLFRINSIPAGSDVSETKDRSGVVVDAR